jgi:hypothetical protein
MRTLMVWRWREDSVLEMRPHGNSHENSKTVANKEDLQ